MRIRLGVVISWVVVFVWMLVIFNFSAQVKGDSNSVSLGVTEVVVNMVEKILPNVDIDVDNVNHIIRKMAHFSIYLVLGMLGLNAMRRSGVIDRKSVYISLLICVLYAMSDEIHQSFVPGRGPQVRDVGIDSMGAVTGVGVYLFVGLLVRMWRGEMSDI